MNVSNIYIRAERSIAYESPDHLVPWGTARDNSKNSRFNEKIYKIFENNGKLGLKVLDMGCSGGGFVKSCIDDGCLAVGIEGSDYSQKMKRAEWRTIPDYLFTCDITGDFEIYKLDINNNESRIIFDLVTCWEVMEHIKESDLDRLCSNVKKHLSTKGLWIMSVSQTDDIIDGVNLHQTVKPKKWWIDKFKTLGFEHLPKFEKYFNEQYIRGDKYGAPGSFHLILTPDISNAPVVPHIPVATRLLDKYWFGTPRQRFIRKLIVE